MKNVGRTVWDISSTVAVVAAAITMLVLHIHDRGESRREAAETQRTDWQSWSEAAIRVGPDEAPMVVAIFMDFTCPFCGNLVPVLDSLRSEFPEEVALEYYHFLLFGHSFTLQSAKAAECAERQGKFEDMYHFLFEQADLFGSKEWRVFASEAGLRDLNAFERCIHEPLQAFPRITKGRLLGDRLGVRGTPTVWVNGHLFLGRNLDSFRRRASDLGL